MDCDGNCILYCKKCWSAVDIPIPIPKTYMPGDILQIEFAISKEGKLLYSATRKVNRES